MFYAESMVLTMVSATGNSSPLQQLFLSIKSHSPATAATPAAAAAAAAAAEGLFWE